MGYDVHRFVDGRTLILGGVTIPFERGLEGHSDADVLVHAVCDSLLGAAALRDIGYHFADTDPQFKNISSLRLLGRVSFLLQKAGFAVVNIDSTVILQAPKIAPFVPGMRRAIANTLGLPIDAVSVKATTNEGIGGLGRGEGCAAFAVTLLRFVGEK